MSPHIIVYSRAQGHFTSTYLHKHSELWMQDIPVVSHQASQHSYLIWIPISRLTILLSFIVFVFLQTFEANNVISTAKQFVTTQIPKQQHVLEADSIRLICFASWNKWPQN